MIVLKFGGSSLKSLDLIKRVAKNIASIRETEQKVIVVVSAMGKTTDNLIKEATSVGTKINNEILDRLLNLGELKSTFLLTLALEGLKEKTTCLNGGEAGIVAGGNFGNGFIKTINTTIIKNAFKKCNIVVVAGFCAKTSEGKIITLGRGGSDTTAVALASAFNCKCKIFTDVSTISALDPHVFADAKKYNQISTDDMLELSAFGAKVLETRCVEIAKKYRTEICLTNKDNFDNTIISNNFENLNVCGISKIDGISMLSIACSKTKTSTILQILKENLTKLIMFNINNILEKDEIKIAIFSTKLEKIAKKLEKNTNNIKINSNLSVVSIVGFGFCQHVQNVFDIVNCALNKNIRCFAISQTERVLNILCSEKDAINNMAYLKKILKL